MLTISDQLHAVRALIEDEARWCTRWFAFDKNGYDTKPGREDAVRWCIDGACLKIGVKGSARKLLHQQATILFGVVDIVDVNDRLGHAAVMQLLDAAIAEAEKEHA